MWIITDIVFCATVAALFFTTLVIGAYFGDLIKFIVGNIF